MKVVDHHFRLWQDELGGVEVGTPHVHTNQGNLILVGQTVQVIDNSRLVPISQQINDAAVADVANDATGLVEQMNLVNADGGTHSRMVCLRILGGLLENAPDGSLIDSNVIGYTGKRSPDRLAGKIEHQALRHQVMFVHVVKWLQKGLMALSALIAPSYDIDPCAFSSDGDVHEQLWPGSVSIQQRAGAMRTARNHRLLLGGDLEVMRILLHGQNAPMGPAKNIQWVLPLPQILPRLFFQGPVITVKEGERLRIHSTHFAGFYVTRPVEVFYTLCRIAIVSCSPGSYATINIDELAKLAGKCCDKPNRTAKVEFRETNAVVDAEQESRPTWEEVKHQAQVFNAQLPERLIKLAEKEEA